MAIISTKQKINQIPLRLSDHKHEMDKNKQYIVKKVVRNII